MPFEEQSYYVTSHLFGVCVIFVHHRKNITKCSSKKVLLKFFFLHLVTSFNILAKCNMQKDYKTMNLCDRICNDLL